jgi:hypothetical protein
MLYNLSLYLNPLYLTAALAAVTCFVIITMAKEKRDERKRA